MAIGALQMIRHANTESPPSLLWLRPPIEQLVGIGEEPPVVSVAMASSSTTGVASSRTSSPEIVCEVGVVGEVNADTTEAAALLGQLVELVADVGAARQLNLTKEGAAAVEDTEVGVEVTVAGSRLEQQRSEMMATLTLDGFDAAVGAIVYSAEAVVRPEQFVEHVVGGRAARFPSCTAHASRKAAWRLAIFSAHTGSLLALSSASSMRRLPASPNELVRRLAVSSADSLMEPYVDLSRAALMPACTAASIEDTS
jgi:hypothetical protein